MNRLFIRLTEIVNKNTTLEESITLEDSLSWILLSETSEVIESGSNIGSQDLRKRLEDKGLVYKEVVFFPPDHRVKVRRIPLAKGQHRHIDKIAPYLLEEFFAQPPEELHLTLLNRTNKQAIWVSVIAKEHITTWLSSLTLMGWHHPTILPIAGVLPFWPQQDDDSAFLYASDTHYLLKDDDSIVHVPTTLLTQLPKREGYQVSCDKDTLAELPLASAQLTPISMWSNTRANEKGKLETWLFTLAQTVQKNKHVLAGNICHGTYRQKVVSQTNYSGWLWIAALILFCFCAELYLTFKQTSELTNQADTITATSKKEFLTLVPDEGRVFHLKRQIQSRIQRAKQGATNRQHYSVYEVMALVDQVRDQLVGQHRIIKLDFANDVIRLDWQAKERETLDKLRVTLQATPLNALMEQVTKRGERHVASIKITLGE